MRHLFIALNSLLLLCAVFLSTVVCWTNPSEAARASADQAPTSLTQAELEKLVQPVALYPDLLLQQLLTASTFPEQILDAALYNEQGKDPQRIKDQPWDESVKAMANYPSILSKLANDLDWTITLGSAFINQTMDVRNAIQTMRARAKAVGNLKDSEQQTVIQESAPNGTTVIRIEPTEPEVVYVPVTTTSVVYEKPVESSSALVPVATFGLGMALGYAMGDDDDDDNYYYGGGGYYGPGFWHNGDAAEDWVDHRQDRWDDRYDLARDRQEWNQDNRDDWREYRQDLGRKQQDWRQEAKNRPANMSPEKRAEATTRVNNSKANWQSKSPEQRKAAANEKGYTGQNVNKDNLNQAKQNRQAGQGSFSKSPSRQSPESIDRSQANARLNQARGNPEVQQRAQTRKSSPDFSSSGFGSSSSRSSSNRSSNSSRGSGLSDMSSGSRSVNRSESRGTASRSRSSSGGGYSRGGGGSFSRGGGSRGGGGRGGGRR